MVATLLSLFAAILLDRAGVPHPKPSYKGQRPDEVLWRYQRSAFRAAGIVTLVIAVDAAGDWPVLMHLAQVIESIITTIKSIR